MAFIMGDTMAQLDQPMPDILHDYSVIKRILRIRSFAALFNRYNHLAIDALLYFGFKLFPIVKDEAAGFDVSPSLYFYHSALS